MEKEINDIDDLIGKALVGEASQEEKSRLKAWSDLSAENKKYVDQIKTIFDRAASNTVQLDFDTDAAWKKVKARLYETREDRDAHSIQSFNWSNLRIAASVIFMIGIGYFVYQFNNKPTRYRSGHGSQQPRKKNPSWQNAYT